MPTSIRHKVQADGNVIRSAVLRSILVTSQCCPDDSTGFMVQGLPKIQFISIHPKAVKISLKSTNVNFVVSAFWGRGNSWDISAMKMETKWW